MAFLHLLDHACDTASYEEDLWHPDLVRDKAETGTAELPRGDQWVAACHQPLQCYMQPCLAPPAATVPPLHSNSGLRKLHVKAVLDYHTGYNPVTLW